MFRRALVYVVLACASGCAKHAAESQRAAETPRICPPVRADSGSGKPLERMRATILAGLKLQPKMRFADIGAGGGWFLTRAAVQVAPGGLAYGTDIDPHAVAVLRAQPRLPVATPIDVRLARRQYDTALDDLPAGSLDLIMMIDSLCFDHRAPRSAQIAYLRRFLRLLKPGGRLAHHMDCTCKTTVRAVEALFADAGFSTRVDRIPLTCDDIDTKTCRSPDQQAIGKFVGVFEKPR